MDKLKFRKIFFFLLFVPPKRREFLKKFIILISRLSTGRVLTKAILYQDCFTGGNCFTGRAQPLPRFFFLKLETDIP